MRNPRAAKLLAKGCSPQDGCNLATAPRRLTNEDVGYHGRRSEREASITGDERDPPTLSIVDNDHPISCEEQTLHHYQDESEDENPFGFDTGMDVA